MLNSNESKKINKKKKKKRNEISLEEYEEENHTRINLGFKFDQDTENIEEFPKKSNYLRYQSNIINDKKNESFQIKNNLINNNNSNRKDSEIESLYKSNKKLNIEKNQISASTINSSFDEDNKNNDNNEKIKNIIKNAINENKNYKISSAINNAKILDSYKSNNNNYNYNPYIINNNFNRIDNFNYFINNNFNYNNYLFNYNNYKNYNNCKYIITYNYYLYSDKLKNNKKELTEVEKEIKLLENILENKTLPELFIENQFQEIINYIKKKKENEINENNLNQSKIIKEDNKETPQHPYFYISHDEEIQIKNVLYLIEGLFHEDNLKKDYNLLKMLNRDGYASIKELEKHPQVNLCKVSEIHLNTVFSEHRGNEVTETVETFDDILIRNKNWIKIKKEIGNIEAVEDNTLNNIRIQKDLEMKNLLEKKEKCIENQKKILEKYNKKNMNIQQKMNELSFNYNNIYNNIYNNNFNGFNNVYNNNIFNNTMNNNNLCNNLYNHKRY